jgi:hypothetical protein
VVSKDRARRLQRIYDKHKETREQRELFLRNIDALRGEGAPNPRSYDPKYEGTIFGPWAAADGRDPRDVPDASQ